MDDCKVTIDCRPTADELARIQALATETGAPLQQDGGLWSFECRSGRERNLVALRLAEDLHGRAMLENDGVRIDFGRMRSVLLRVERGPDRRRSREDLDSTVPEPPRPRPVRDASAPPRQREGELDLFER